LRFSTEWDDITKDGTRTNSSRGHIFNLVVIFLWNFLTLHLRNNRYNSIFLYHIPMIATWDWSLEQRARAASSTH
jgi:hypothetical protein